VRARRAAATVTPELMEVLRGSSLGRLPADLLEALTQGGRSVAVGRGEVVDEEGGRPEPKLVISGFMRVFRTAPDGRRIAARYARRGDILAITYQFASREVRSPGGLQALNPSRFFVFDPGTIVRLAERDLLVANALLAETSDRSISFELVGAEMTFATMRQRLSRHLLDLADVDGRGALVAFASQQDLAEAIGTYREVVVRILRDMRADGLIATERLEIHVRDPERLHAESFTVGS